MAPDKKAVDLRVLFEHLFRFRRERFHILAVFQNRQPLAVFMCHDAVEPFQHLIAFNEESAPAGVVIR